jgi:TolB-like protein/DNA-binding SARP family transcriptional activator/tetratricopeptide (TPR) repeat protein
MERVTTSANISLRLLGEFEVRDAAGMPITITARKNQALLAALALAPSCTLTRSRIAGLLWSDRGEEQARTSLRQALVALRKDLGIAGATLLSFGDERVRLDFSRIDIDALEFRKLAKGSDIESLRKAKTLLHGPLLADLEIADPAFESWLAQERRRIDDTTITLLDKLCDHEKENSLLDLARRLVDIDPTREPSHRRLMLAYAQMGERAAALHQYDVLRNVLRDEFDTVPDAETEALRRRLLSAQVNGTNKAAPDDDNEPTVIGDFNGTYGQTAVRELTPNHYERPSVAVLPFLVMGNKPAFDELADGLTEDVITALSHIKAFRVIARNTMFTYKNHSADIRLIGKDVGARYVLEGSIRQSGDRFRFTAQLIESDTGHHIWADRFDQTGQDLFDMQDQVTSHIVTSVQTQIILHEGREQTSADGYTPHPAQLLAQSWQKLLFMSADSLASSRSLAERAMAIDSKSTHANRMMAVVLYHQAYMGYIPWTHSLIDRVHNHASLAVQADDADEYCYWAMETSHLLRGEHDLAMIALERALQINSNCSIAIGSKGTVLAWAGLTDESIKQNRLALHLNRHDPSNFYRHFGLSLAHYLASQYEIALEHARVVHQSRPDWWLGQVMISACLAHLHKEAEARHTLSALLQERPTLGSMLEMLPFAQQSDRNHLMRGLNKAGLGAVANA